MSSYQHHYSVADVYRDSSPDYLTCGYCAQEFLLDNITLFIAHKTGGCDKSTHARLPDVFNVVDSSSPLTCSSCSRVFMTARGLLHHVQEEHQMNICLQKGPLIVPDPTIRPPPAHSTLNRREFITTDSQATSPRGSQKKPTTRVDCCDEPTDLSMSCSNSLGNATVKCTEEECKIIIGLQPNILRKQENRPSSAVPKKRKFVFPTSFEHELNTVVPPTTTGLTEEDNDVIAQNIQPDLANEKEKADSDVSIRVSASYDKNSLCCVSLSSGKKDEGNIKLKRLLQKNQHIEEATYPGAASDDDKTNKSIYKSTCLTPSSSELSQSQLSFKHNSAGGNFNDPDTSDIYCEETQSKSVKYLTPKFVFGSTLEQNIDQLIRASISSDIYTKDLEIPANDQDTSTVHFSESGYHTPAPTTAGSSKFILPDENNKTLSHSSSDPNSPFVGEEEKAVVDPVSRIQQITQDVPGHENNSPFIFPGSVSSFISPLPMGFLKKSLDPPTTTLSPNPSHPTPSLSLNVPFAESIYQDIPSSDQHTFTDILRKQDNGFISSSRQMDKSHLPVDDDSLSGFNQHQQLSTTSQTLTPPVSTVSTLLYRTSPNLELQDDQDDDSMDFIVTRNTPTTSSLDPSGIDKEDFTLTGSKVGKKRRYPTSRPFKCAHCDQAFNQRIHLKKHMSKHTGVKPFKCQQCDYSTVERSHLKVHYRIHTGEKPYRCIYCDYATAQNSTLKIHLKRHHDGLYSSESSSKRSSLPQTALLGDDNSHLQDAIFVGISASGQSLGKRGIDAESAVDSGATTESMLSIEPYARLKSDQQTPVRELTQQETMCSAHRLTALRYHGAAIREPENNGTLERQREAKDTLNVSCRRSEPTKFNISTGHHSSKALSEKDTIFLSSKALSAQDSLRSSFSQRTVGDEVETVTVRDQLQHDTSETTQPALGPVFLSPAGSSNLKEKSQDAKPTIQCVIGSSENTDSPTMSKLHNPLNYSERNINDSSRTHHHDVFSRKTDNVVSSQQVDDDYDDNDLDYSPALPCVTIPDKAFVRG